MGDIKKDPFEEYIKQAEPGKNKLGYAWRTAIGLQDVDGLKTSDYLKKTAIDNIEGKITLEEANSLIQSYYKEAPHDEAEHSKEADVVSGRITTVLSEEAFTFSVPQYVGIHKRLFEGIYDHAGKIRDYNISKKEWVLGGESVHYGNASELREMLEYDVKLEREYKYNLKNEKEIISHLADFVSRLWQIHAFGEGNTRTTAVFFIKYLRMMGYEVTNDIFAENAWYFRNALVRTNYNDFSRGIRETTEYLELFLENLLLTKKNELKNRRLHISRAFEKQDIENGEQDIEGGKQDIHGLKSFSEKTKSNIKKLLESFGYDTFFGRSDVVKVLGITPSPASALIKKCWMQI